MLSVSGNSPYPLVTITASVIPTNAISEVDQSIYNDLLNNCGIAAVQINTIRNKAMQALNNAQGEHITWSESSTLPKFDLVFDTQTSAYSLDIDTKVTMNGLEHSYRITILDGIFKNGIWVTVKRAQPTPLEIESSLEKGYLGLNYLGFTQDQLDLFDQQDLEEIPPLEDNDDGSPSAPAGSAESSDEKKSSDKTEKKGRR